MFSSNLFSDLLQYNRDSNVKVIQALHTASLEADSSMSKLMSHILNAHHIWNARILGLPPSFGVWELQPPENYLELNEQNHSQTLAILENQDLNQSCVYANSSGTPYRNQIGDMIWHVINHSTYHRAQIATLSRQLGLEPIPTDYIFWKREAME